MKDLKICGEFCRSIPINDDIFALYIKSILFK